MAHANNGSYFECCTRQTRLASRLPSFSPCKLYPLVQGPKIMLRTWAVKLMHTVKLILKVR